MKAFLHAIVSGGSRRAWVLIIAIGLALVVALPIALFRQLPTAPETSDPNVIFSGFLTLFTLALVVVGAWQGYLLKRSIDVGEMSAEAAKTAANAAIAAQRPWVKIKVQATDLQILNDNIQIETTVLLTNVGNTPATLLVIWATLKARRPVADPKAIADIEISRKAVAGFRKSGDIGITLFPNDPHVRGQGSTLGDHNLADIGIDPARDGKQITLIFSGIVSYKFIGGSGETPFSFEIQLRDASNTNWHYPSLTAQRFTETELRLRDTSDGHAAT